MQCLVEDFACALKKRVLLQGRMYVVCRQPLACGTWLCGGQGSRLLLHTNSCACPPPRRYVFTTHVCFSCNLFGYQKIKVWGAGRLQKRRAQKRRLRCCCLRAATLPPTLPCCALQIIPLADVTEVRKRKNVGFPNRQARAGNIEAGTRCRGRRRRRWLPVSPLALPTCSLLCALGPLLPAAAASS